MRMSGPPVQQVTQADSVDLLKNNNPVFFTYVGSQASLLWDSFYNVAEAYQAHSSFYATTPEIARLHFDIDTIPSILVYKEKTHSYFPRKKAVHSVLQTLINNKLSPLSVSDSWDRVDRAHLNASLHRWTNEERFPVFPRVTRSNINELMSTRKFLVLAVVEENKLAEIATHELEFRDLVETVIRTDTHREPRFRHRFQFGWVGSPELAHSIAIDTLPTPHLLVLNSTTNEHHIPDDDPLQMTVEAVRMFLEGVHNQSAPAMGGNAFHVRLYRSYFEARRSLLEMWKGNPILTSVLFGLPLGFLSLIMYSICCADILDADPEEDEEDHEKRE